MRIAGAQIPVTNDVSKNYEAIKKACDWAIENNVDYLFTPENALSGYLFFLMHLQLHGIEH